MSGNFAQGLELRAPDENLGSGSHAVQTVEIMVRFEHPLDARCPDAVLVYGDVNSTVAAALVCANALVPVAHAEAGLAHSIEPCPKRSTVWSSTGSATGS